MCCCSPVSRPLPAARGVPRSCDTRAASLLPTRGALSSSVDAAAAAAPSCGAAAPCLVAACPCPATGCWARPCVPGPAAASPRAPPPGCTLHCSPSLTAAASFGDTEGLGTLPAAALRLCPAAALPSSPSCPSGAALVLTAALLVRPTAGAAASCSAAAADRAAAGVSGAPPTRSALDLKPAGREATSSQGPHSAAAFAPSATGSTTRRAPHSTHTPGHAVGSAACWALTKALQAQCGGVTAACSWCGAACTCQRGGVGFACTCTCRCIATNKSVACWHCAAHKVQLTTKAVTAVAWRLLPALLTFAGVASSPRCRDPAADGGFLQAVYCGALRGAALVAHCTTGERHGAIMHWRQHNASSTDCVTT